MVYGAYGGKKLILAGGRDVKGLNLFNDVYSFDVATSVWSKLADSFILWGIGVKEGLGFNHEEGPAIPNIVSNTWGNKYRPGQTPINSADRPNVILSKI
ncbi:hypothetical protein BGX34_005624 [Mortierella sp. NVP85]|nr:hypothetical protein BGX34_005624 [Mortierella sp. NVP85]